MSSTSKKTLPLPPSIVLDRTERLLVRFLETEVGRTGYSRIVLGLSGGIDSAVVAALAVKAFGTDSCLGVLLPHRISSAASVDDAMRVAEALSLPTQQLDISKMADSFPVPELTPLRQGNLLARLRMAVIFDVAARENALVIGTSNKTELLLGYSTWFGDGAWSMCPIGDLYKCQIVALAKHLELPPVVWEKKPSADLWAGQTDEGELGFSYDDADSYLWHRIDLRWKSERIIECGFNADIAAKIERRIAISHYKRNLSPIAKLQVRSVGSDFLYPRDTGT